MGVYITTFLISLVLVLLLMPLFIRLMVKYRILDKAGGRKIHTGYTAHMGGVVIFLGFVISVTTMIFAYFTPSNFSYLISFAFSLFIMILVGVRDDMNSLGAWTKLLFEIAVGLLFCHIGITITSMTGFNSQQIINIPEWLSYPITIFFFIVVVNSYNLIDGIDGQAGMQALNTFLFLFLFFVFQVRGAAIGTPLSPMFIEICLIAIMGAVIGFLKYNWQKAKIFMGDTGSLFIGTLITIFIILAMKYNADISTEDSILGLKMKAHVAPFLGYFYLPFADTLRVFISRIRRGKSPFAPDKTHIHHFFIRLGYSHQRCTLTTFTISFCISIISTILAFFVSDIVFIIIIVLSWFLYVELVHIMIVRRVKSIGGGDFVAL